MARLNKITLNPEYRRRWNVNPSSQDFYELVDEETGLRLEAAHDEIFRVGGFHTNDIAGKRLFKLLRQVESRYDGDWCKDYTESRRRHLADCECVVNSDGKVIYTGDEHMIDTYINIVSDRLFSVSKHSHYELYDAETGEIIFKTDAYGDNSKLENRKYIFLCPRGRDWECRYKFGPYKDLSDEVIRIDKQTAEITVVG